MKRNIIYPVLLATSVGIFAGCVTQKECKIGDSGSCIKHTHTG